MKELKFITGPLAKGFKPDFESFLFNDEQHRLLQSSSGWQSYFLVREDAQKQMAAIHFNLRNDIASSPSSAPFGSVEFSKKLQPKDRYEFLHQVEADMKNKGVRIVRIKNPPEAYDPASSSLLNVMLFNLGYHVAHAEISAIIAVDEIKYENRISADKLPKLKKGKKENLVFQTVPISRMEEIYEFISACRAERLQSLSMTLADLMKTVHVFPDRFLLFAIYRDQELAAASISIRVTTRILYNFYLAHPRKLNFLSPVVSLMEGIYGWSQQRGIKLIDLGTSSLEGQPNFSLLDFKLRLSGSPSDKFTFEKELN